MRSKQNAILQNGLTRKRRAYINFPSTIDLRGDFDFLNWLKKINREMCHRNLAQTIIYVAKKYKEEISHVDTGETL
jgi:hypothetical protein